ncbi:hypothetical protein EJ04DRAFT_162154 [Polyplosphaeria fusca]|uniref:Uncharacterized protein n=1 Tax=Polyplosphaeria fusca TaxID=682080 RepID=A0A9P4RCA0_9PLEO|nr:hypothetical protein EJ04DRAFT_162154 [Polyplosphaeria fusca]
MIAQVWCKPIGLHAQLSELTDPVEATLLAIHIVHCTPECTHSPRSRRQRCRTYLLIWKIPPIFRQRKMQQTKDTCSTYTSVKALLLYWEERDSILQGVEREVDKLQRLFRNEFCFHAEAWKLPCDGTVKSQLARKLIDFTEHACKGELLILYYGGHANNAGGSCTWSAGVGNHSVEWNNIAQNFTNNDSDVLFILDCCEATSAVAAFSGGQARHGANWLLASSGIDSSAAAVSRMDFTRLMIRTLKDMANDFFENDLPRIFSEDLHTSLHLDHWDKLVTNAVHVRLNKRRCGEIDLTPLISRNAQKENEDGYIKYQLEHPVSTTSLGMDFLDIWLVAGGDGNPVTSFTAKLSDGSCMWPQEVLCPMLEAGRIRCRLLPFQHRWNGQGYSDYEIQKFKRSAKALRDVVYGSWKSNPRRPLLFLAYGRGCTVVRKALRELKKQDFGSTMPNIGCILCGTNSKWEEIYSKSGRSRYPSRWEDLSQVILWIDRQPQRAPGFPTGKGASILRQSSSSRERRSSPGPSNGLGGFHDFDFGFTSADNQHKLSWNYRPQSRPRSRSREKFSRESRSRERERSRSRGGQRRSRSREGQRRSRSRGGQRRSRSRGRARSAERQSTKRAPTPPFATSFDDPSYNPKFTDIGRARPRRPSSADRAFNFGFSDTQQRPGSSRPLGFGDQMNDRYEPWFETRPDSAYNSGRNKAGMYASSADSDRGRRRYGDFFVDLNEEIAANRSSQRLDLMLETIETLFINRSNWQGKRSGVGADYSWRRYIRP